ncbi:hypothetical protein IVG45_21145 [Methylomonas sp. LL1]|uniref:hypothetical protein n=1 Tax=Methylomonas sp. LL1 TaxID=2785785 RepID=UPI0018C3E9F4|nr:hypothetical protein [Methylomonas sp. LL1]QPK63279.1 hypothetical protein IVG45_21145 [Methylomonas sp. LL1]
MDDINWNDWLNREEITIDDALWLSMSAPIRPPGTSFPETSLFDDEYKERREIAESWRKKGLLPGKIKFEEKDRDWYIKPLIFFRLARDIEWLNPLNSEHDPIFNYLEKMDKSERKISEKAHIQRLTDFVNKSPKSLDSDSIAELWAAMPGESYENKPFWQIRDDYKKQIEIAVIGGELEAVVEIREPGFDDGYKEIADKNRIRKIKDGWLNGTFVRFTIYREQFEEWLKKSKQWPVVDSCLLFSWFDSEPKAEVVVDDVRQVTESGNQRYERELKQGLREIWVKEGRPEMKAFFPNQLKKYVNQSGSPITEVYTAGKDAGFAFKLSTGTTGNRTKKTLSNYVSEFKKTP